MARRVINGSLFPQSWDEMDAEVVAAEADMARSAAAVTVTADGDTRNEL
jgi:hypothetical protein